jgi:hypothetical protein
LREAASHEHSPFSAFAGFSEALSFVVNADFPMKHCALVNPYPQFTLLIAGAKSANNSNRHGVAQTAAESMIKQAGLVS